MGLALTYTIVNDHSGKIEVDSTLGVGSVVKVKLPINEKTGFKEPRIPGFE